MTEKQIYVAIGVAGLGVIGVIAYQSLKKPQQDYDKLVGEKTPTTTQPQYNPPQNNASQYAAQANNLSYGLTEDERVKLQKYLIGLGYNLGSTGADGIIGDNTINAIKKDIQTYAEATKYTTQLNQGNLKNYFDNTRKWISTRPFYERIIYE